MLKPPYLLVAIPAFWLSTPVTAAEQPLAAATIVLYNKAIPDSVQLAKFYAKQRGIARDHIIGLTCSIDEEISREEYDTTIANPLREIFKTRQWWRVHQTSDREESVKASSIHFVAVIAENSLDCRLPWGCAEARSGRESQRSFG
jgi:uncharacterized protein (TIGR03790 family)